jgi:hypothetical protein
MSKKNKIYWSLGVTEKGTRALLTDENSKFKWLRSQSNRRVLLVFYITGLVLISLLSYSQNLMVAFNLSAEAEISLLIIPVILTMVLYSFLRIAVRGIADAPDELLDERQVDVRNSAYRYAYLSLSYLAIALLLLVFAGPELRLFQDEGNDASFLLIAVMFWLASAPSIFIAWRERDI